MRVSTEQPRKRPVIPPIPPGIVNISEDLSTMDELSTWVMSFEATWMYSVYERSRKRMLIARKLSLKWSCLGRRKSKPSHFLLFTSPAPSIVETDRLARPCPYELEERYSILRRIFSVGIRNSRLKNLSHSGAQSSQDGQLNSSHCWVSAKSTVPRENRPLENKKTIGSP